MTASCLLSRVLPRYDSLVTFLSSVSVTYVKVGWTTFLSQSQRTSFKACVTIVALVSPCCQHRPECDDSIFYVRLCGERLIEILTIRKRDLSIDEYLEHVAA